MPADPKSEADIAKRAYAIWEREGRPEGHDRDHWAEAERGGSGFAEDQRHFGQNEVPEAGAPASDSGVKEAQDQAGEGVPSSSSEGEGQEVPKPAKKPRKPAAKPAGNPRGGKGSSS